jgi:glycerol-3-phosphate acyltransferase PlsX
MLKIAVDAMGGDHAPASEVEGALQAARDLGVSVVLVGSERVVRDELRRHGWRGGRQIEVVDAAERITMSEPVAQAVRRKRNSSLHVAAREVAEGRAAGLVSAGNTGAVMGVAMIKLGTLPSVDRPALATVVPTVTGRGALLLDVGANAECKPEHLAQFAIMGGIYARAIFAVEDPSVGLLSIGEEEVKGNDLTKGTHKLLKSSSVRFVGNVEGRTIFSGEVDVIVCDGFTGNVVLKVSEGLIETIIRMLKQELQASLPGKAGAILSRPAFHAFRKRLDYAEYGGAPLLGVTHPTVICHGRSNARAIRNAIRVAKEFSEAGLDRRIEAELAGGRHTARAGAD